jgi:hypothetical protein
MSFHSDFEQAFMKRSLGLVQAYEGPFDATLLLNCLLGLLIVPKERCLKAIPLDPIESLSEWGISQSAITELGEFNGEDSYPNTLRGLVWRLKNAIAHFRFRQYPERGEVKGFHFDDTSGFRAKVPIQDLRRFVEKLAETLGDM